ncbi:ComEC/Rec2 family competence protein [Prauserella rugosa]|uniref:ComEC/Rec2 family competence protein n=1 Tax=Prauserella rugosa TaxID=43354 RepID=UPI0004C41728
MRAAAQDGSRGQAGRDLRLVPAALVVWAGALVGLLCGWPVAACVGAAAVAGGVLLWLRAHRHRSRAVHAAVALVGCGVLVAGPLTARLHGVEHDPVRSAAEDGAIAELRVELRERPRLLRSDSGGGLGDGTAQGDRRSVLVPVEVVSARVGTGDDAEAVHTTGRMLLIGPAEGWEHLLPGQRTNAVASLAAARPGELTVAVGFVRGPPEGTSEASWWQRSAAMLREGLRSAAGVLGEDEAGLLPGIVVGDTSGQSERVRQEFLDSGLSHLTAVSGTHVGIVCGAVLLLARVLRFGPTVSASVAGVVLVGFVVLVGYQPSVLRAGVMGTLSLAALVLGRRRSAVPALSVAVGGLVLYDPAMATSMAFTLSVVSTAGLVFLASRWAATLGGRRLPPGAAEAVAVPVAAFVVTVPVLGGMVGEISLVSVVANLLATPVVAPVMVLGVLATVVAPLSPDVAELLVHVAGPGVSWLVWVARESAAVPGAVLAWPPGWWGGLLAAVIMVAVLVAFRHRLARTAVVVALVMVLVVLTGVHVVVPGWPPGRWSVVACDVGQGDGLVLATGQPGRAVVVDTGQEPGALDRCLNRLGVDRVPLVVVSHLHADHFGGLQGVFEGRSVGAIAVGQGRTPSWAWQAVVNEARSRQVRLVELSAGDTVSWDALTLDVLGPHYTAPAARQETGEETEDSESSEDGTAINNASLVLRASTPAGRILLTGDIEVAAQGDLLARGVDVRAEILKVPHHGSRHTRREFLTAVRARVALVSVGADNSHGHPNGEIVRTLRGSGALIARTDEGGDIAVVPGDTEDAPVVVRRGQDNRRET